MNVLLSVEEYRRMAEAETRLWWYRNLHAMVVEAVQRNFSSKKIRILDAGCGTGGLLSVLLRLGYEQASGFDVSPEAVKIAESRGVNVRQGALSQLEQLVPQDGIEVAIFNDLLGYVSQAERKTACHDIGKALQPGGLLILNVPAFMIFRGLHDRAVADPRRFTRSELEKDFAGSGLDLEEWTYWPFFLSPIILLTRLWQRVRMKLNPSLQIASDLELPPAWLNMLLYALTAAERKLPWPRPFGSSIFMVLKK